jgi:hypothetical protein
MARSKNRPNIRTWQTILMLLMLMLLVLVLLVLPIPNPPSGL